MDMKRNQDFTQHELAHRPFQLCLGKPPHLGERFVNRGRGREAMQNFNDGRVRHSEHSPSAAQLDVHSAVVPVESCIWGDGEFHTTLQRRFMLHRGVLAASIPRGVTPPAGSYDRAGLAFVLTLILH